MEFSLTHVLHSRDVENNSIKKEKSTLWGRLVYAKDCRANHGRTKILAADSAALVPPARGRKFSTSDRKIGRAWKRRLPSKR
jgi:hypothetical protein